MSWRWSQCVPPKRQKSEFFRPLINLTLHCALYVWDFITLRTKYWSPPFAKISTKLWKRMVAGGVHPLNLTSIIAAGKCVSCTPRQLSSGRRAARHHKIGSRVGLRSGLDVPLPWRWRQQVSLKRRLIPTTCTA